MLILTNHLWDTQVATADGLSKTSLQEGRFNPIQEEHEGEEHEEIESTLGRLEVIRQLAAIAENDTATAAYALMRMEEIMEEENEAIEVLNHLLDSNPAKPIKNLIRMKLAEIHLWSGQNEEATEVLVDLIKD